MVKGKWAAGIPPRNFTWIVKDQMAVSERPGGFAPHHRRVRRQEEIIWLRVQGFNRVVSLLPSPHNLAAYDEGELVWSHFPLASTGDVREMLLDLYRNLDTWLRAGERLLLHQEELGDRVMGIVAGHLLWSGRLPGGPQAIAVVERLIGHPMGPPGLDMVARASGARRPRPRLRRRPGDVGTGAYQGDQGDRRDRIEVRGLRVDGVHGVFEEERGAPSPSRWTSTSTSTPGPPAAPTTWPPPPTTRPWPRWWWR